jgi:hypothetical protein
MRSDPTNEEVYLLFTKTILTDHPVIVPSDIEDYSIAAIA